MKKWFIIAGAVLIILGAGYFAANRGLNKPDEILIRELLQRAEVSIENKDLKQAMSCVSGNYKSRAGGNYEGLRLIGAQAFRSEMRFDIEFDAPDVKTNGNSARVMTKVIIDDVANPGRERIFSGAVNLGMDKEPRKRYWIFPVRVWKIVSCENSFSQWVEQESGM